MDLLQFEGQELYFDEPLDQKVHDLIAAASELYADGDAEASLLEAYDRAPASLTVLVALYRFYYYQHRLEEAVAISEKALDITASDLAIPRDFSLLSEMHIGRAALGSMVKLRFHLLCLKAEGYLLLRLGRQEEGKAMLRKLVELDSNNRLGARQLLEVVEPRLRLVG